MPREYQHLKSKEKEIFKLRENGLTYREIGEQLGYEPKKIKKFFERDRARQRKIEAGISLKRRGRPSKDYVVTEQDRIAELKYILARKEAKIKTLEMENELMRDFLSLTERK